MSHDLRRISFFAVVFLVLLRLSIGWQFLYEGLWKYQTQSTGNPWTAEGYLQNAQGPFRSTFRNMTGDPDGLNWLDNKYVQAKWDDWANRFTEHYQLDDAQKARLEEILSGPKNYEVALDDLPEAVAKECTRDRSGRGFIIARESWPLRRITRKSSSPPRRWTSNRISKSGCWGS